MREKGKKNPVPRTKPGRPYRPPRVSKVPIRVDEVVLAACKEGGGGAEYASCVVGCALPGS